MNPAYKHCVRSEYRKLCWVVQDERVCCVVSGCVVAAGSKRHEEGTVTAAGLFLLFRGLLLLSSTLYTE